MHPDTIVLNVAAIGAGLGYKEAQKLLALTRIPDNLPEDQLTSLELIWRARRTFGYRLPPSSLVPDYVYQEIHAVVLDTTQILLHGSLNGDLPQQQNGTLSQADVMRVSRAVSMLFVKDPGFQDSFLLLGAARI